MKPVFLLCILCFSFQVEGQHFTLRSAQDNSTKTFQAGKAVKIITPSYILADHQLQTYQTASGTILQVTNDSIIMQCRKLKNFGEGVKGNYKSEYAFSKSGQIQIALAKRDVRSVERISKTRNTFGVIAIVSGFVGASSLLSAAFVADKEGAHRLLKIGAISASAGIVLGIASSSRPTRINSADCWSPWMVE